MHISLAPMEGVVDYPMRLLLTELGGYDRCVTEFIRVTDVLLPDRVFFRYCRELEHGCHTLSGTPVHIQLLGSDPAAMALNARQAVVLGAVGIDLNFGCPAKTVNKSNGGSILLRDPDRVAAIVQAVRDAVEPGIPVNAKIRLGYETDENFEEVAEKVFLAGANELCVHARTKVQGYKPPAYWPRAAAIATGYEPARLTINGEIWSVEDAQLALHQSQFGRVMLGRTALARPDLALQIKASLSADWGGEAAEAGHKLTALPWSEIFKLVQIQFNRSDKASPHHIGNRTKQWLAYLKRTYPEAELLFTAIKRLHDEQAIKLAMDQHQRELESSSRLSLQSSLAAIEQVAVQSPVQIAG